MSRIGKKPVPVPAGVKVDIAGDRRVTVQGKLGTLSITHRPEVSVRVDDEAGAVVVERLNQSRPARAYHGLTRALIRNMVQGVTEGFRKQLEIIGVGWNAQVQGQNLRLNVGYADTRVVAIPDGVNVEVAGNRINVSGPDRQVVGQLAAVIRGQRPPEPYNGKGIKYSDEVIVRKQGKAFGSGG